MVSDEPSGLVLINKKERINGWTCPLHPFQIIAWFFVIAIAIIYFGILAAYLPKQWIPAGYIIPGVLLFIHIIFHLVCISLDPADPKIRQKNVAKASEFDRAHHKHVIENNHCYICQVDVGAKSKHCSLCNKCVSEFDHHCKWLNNCIGGQNYRLFIACLVTALVTCLVLMAFNIYIFVLFFKNDQKVMSAQAWILFPNLDKVAFLCLTVIVIVLLLVTLMLLLHLMCFHIFLMFKGFTTYEFIVKNRQSSLNISIENGSSPAKFKPCKNKIADGAELSNKESVEMSKR